MSKTWQQNKSPIQPEVFQKACDYGFCELLANTLARRSYLNNANDLNSFLEKKRSNLLDPFSLPDMSKAVDCTMKAIQSGEKILIYGDFDADGLSALSILYWGLRKAGVKEGLYFYIPNRFSEGHGLNKEVISRFRSEGVRLLLTVDCGMGSAEEILYAREIGIQVIVTDHHLSEGELIGAFAVVNPQLGTYPFSGLSGAGVAFKFVQALLWQMFGADSEIYETTINNCIDYACIGTVADVMPLVGENRILVDWGLKHMSDSRLPFLRNYWKKRIFGHRASRPFCPADISFYMAPRLNAASRLSKADVAFQFMISVKDKELEQLGASLETMNKNRIMRLQNLHRSTNLIYYPLVSVPLIVLDTQSDELGLLGLLASTLVDKTGRAAIVLGQTPNGVLAGSARSNDSIDLKAILDDVADVLLTYGGHQRAAGLSLQPELLPALLQKLEEVGQYQTFHVDKQKYYEGILSAADFNDEFLRQYGLFSPFGKDNEPPLIGLSGFTIANFRQRMAGGGSFTLKLNNQEIKASFKKDCDFHLTDNLPQYLFGNFYYDTQNKHQLSFAMKGFQ